MPPRTTNYHTVDGFIECERTPAFTSHDYVPDALGSIQATASPISQDLQYSARHYPFGLGYSVGTTNTLPRFRWVGAAGYSTTDRWHSHEYVRARHFSFSDSRWTTADPLMLLLARTKLPLSSSLSYQYVVGRPTTFIDSTGLSEKCLTFSLTIPIELLGMPLLFSPGVTICCEPFDTSCCKNGSWASSCVSIIANAGLSIPLDAGLSQIEQLPEELLQAFEEVSQTFSQLVHGVFNLIQCGTPEKDCHPKSYKFLFDICGTYCIGFAYGSCCLGDTAKSGCGPMQLGPCGSPALGLEVDLGVQICQ